MTLTSSPPAPPPAAPEPGPRPRSGPAPSRVAGRRRGEAVVTAVVLAASVGLVLAAMQPDLLARNTTPAGGDMGAHVWGPAFLRDHLLPRGRLSGWAPDWYAGFPAYQFYMVVPSLFILALDVLLPYNVAFKLVSVSGLLALPLAAWGMGRLARLPFPVPPLLALAAVPFLFDRSFTIYGGNAASTLAGEFAFSISLAVALLFLGMVLRGLGTGRGRAVAAALLALCALCHIIPAIFALGAAVLALLVRRPSWARLRWMAGTVVVGGLLTSFWTVPFVLRRAYLNDMGWEKLTTYWEHLFPGRVGEALSGLSGNGADAAVTGDITVVAIMAAVGVAASLAARRRFGIYLGVLAGVLAVAFVLAPQGRLWNARLLPFWYLCLYLLAAVAVAEVVAAFAALATGRDDGRPRSVDLATPLLAGAVLFVAVALPLKLLPFGSTAADGSYSWGPLSVGSADTSFVPDWARWNYSGYEDKDAWPEYDAVVDTMAGVGEDVGCGRAMWEYEEELNRFGTPMALMLLPYWTDGCIGSMEGLYFEASATTPYHFLNQAELSARPSSAQRDLPYSGLDVDAGVEHLQLLGVRYYMAFSDSAVSGADANADLTLVATSGRWHVYEVAEADLVEPLTSIPAVLDDVPEGGEGWLDPAVDWYVDPDRRDVFLAADGPDDWPRVSSADRPTARPVAPVEVRDVEADVDSISFGVDEPGTPVLVKASYFPNWEVSGAEGPWRVAPNLMVVVPTDTTVELSYGRTSVDGLGLALTALGLLGLVAMARSGPLALPPPRPMPRHRRRDPGQVHDDDVEVPAPRSS